MMASDIQDAVFDFMRERCVLAKKERLSLESSLNDDLDIDGDDAIEFFEAFTEKFNVDLTELGEDWSLYFAPEGFSLFGPPDGSLTLFTAQPQPRKGRPLPLLIERLVLAAQTGRWKKLSTG
jgi:acyl carrier protein